MFRQSYAIMDARERADLSCLDGSLGCGCCDTCDAWEDVVYAWERKVTGLAVTGVAVRREVCGVAGHTECWDVEIVTPDLPQTWVYQADENLHGYVTEDGKVRVSGALADGASSQWVGGIVRRINARRGTTSHRVQSRIWVATVEWEADEAVPSSYLGVTEHAARRGAVEDILDAFNSNDEEAWLHNNPAPLKDPAALKAWLDGYEHSGEAVAWTRIEPQRLLR